MPLRAVGVTALLTALCWGAWDWASSNGHATIGIVAGVLLVPFALALIGCLALTVVGLARIATERAAARRARARALASGADPATPAEPSGRRIAA
ncbi:MAG: hypothetical protein ABR946_05665 [Solirubrobacteraceae bacterium]|jgi:TRAP-type C4-dicarboxylate transport system permease small subunit